MTMENRTSADQGADAAKIGLVSLITADVLRRAAIVAIVLGTVLTLANQSGAIFGDSPIQFLPLALVYLTPFIVVSLSQALGIRRAVADAGHKQAFQFPQAGVLSTAVSHGIPMRALLVGLIIGSVNTAIVISLALVDRGNLDGIPTALIAQAFVLPMLFGLVSQAISYRRAAFAIAGRQSNSQMASL